MAISMRMTMQGKLLILKVAREFQRIMHHDD
jgi:hypothetical protein